MVPTGSGVANPGMMVSAPARIYLGNTEGKGGRRRNDSLMTAFKVGTLVYGALSCPRGPISAYRRDCQEGFVPMS